MKKARVEIIPLIDVIFFLLATFVLFTLSLNKLQSLPLPLPKAGPPSEVLRIQASARGTLYWDGELISPSDLSPRLASYKQANPNPRVMVTGDDKADFGAAVRVLDEVRAAGIGKVSLETHVRASGR